MRETDPVEPVRESSPPAEGRREGGSKLRARLDAVDGGRPEPGAPVTWQEEETVDVRGSAAADGPGRAEAFAEASPPRQELTEAERAAIEDYSGTGYLDLNSGLREGSVSPEQRARAEAISAGLAKLPPFEGEVYRGADIDPQIGERYRAGAVVTEDAFTSTSRTLPFEGNTYWTIQSRQGRDISAISRLPEDEVLFDRGSRFRITQNFVFDGNRFIEMEEVD